MKFGQCNDDFYNANNALRFCCKKRPDLDALSRRGGALKAARWDGGWSEPTGMQRTISCDGGSWHAFFAFCGQFFVALYRFSSFPLTLTPWRVSIRPEEVVPELIFSGHENRTVYRNALASRKG